jgi:hypothetical protein
MEETQVQRRRGEILREREAEKVKGFHARRRETHVCERGRHGGEMNVKVWEKIGTEGERKSRNSDCDTKAWRPGEEASKSTFSVS